MEVIQQTASVILAALEPPMPDEAEAVTPANADEAQLQEARNGHRSPHPHHRWRLAPRPPPAHREVEHEPRMTQYQAQQERKEEERKADFKRQQKEYEAEQVRREKQCKARAAAFERIVEHAPASFNVEQMRLFLRLLIHLDYSFLEKVAVHFANGDENTQQTGEEIVLAALDATGDEKLTGLALRIVLSDHIGIPHESQPDVLTEAEQVFAPKKPKPSKAKSDSSSKPKPAAVKASPKKEAPRKKAA